MKELLRKPEVLLGIGIVVMSYFTYVHNYTNPPYLFWDENYHIASAQKYLHGIFFMEPHPPLGKMLIAAGEWILDRNPADDQFIGTDYGKELPAGFSFAGYRLFPVLFAWAIAPMFFVIFLLISRNPTTAFFLSFLYVFDNALITHSRAAMLDSTMLFFVAAMILLYHLLREWRKNPRAFLITSFLFGMAFGGLMVSKIMGLVMILLFPIVILGLKKPGTKLFEFHVKNYDTEAIGKFFVASLLGFLTIYVGVWQLHFSMGKTVITELPDQGYYQASEEYQALLNDGKTNFPLMLRENLAFTGHYAKGVPELNLCKDDENGSPFFLWPFGARSINYRWETPDGNVYRYITLVANPAVWGISLLAVILAAILTVGSTIIPGADRLRHGKSIGLWLFLYIAYMVAVARIDRVMYLYHYFIPLLFTFVLVGYVWEEIRKVGTAVLSPERKQWGLLFLGLIMFLCFHFFRPLSYYEPIGDDAFRKRMIFPLWELRCVKCERESLFALPIMPSPSSDL